MPSQITGSNRVKHGAVLSPILFILDYSGLFEQLENSGVECHMGNRIRVVSDTQMHDTTLLTPMRKIWIQDFNRGMRKMCRCAFRGRNWKTDNRTVF